MGKHVRVVAGDLVEKVARPAKGFWGNPRQLRVTAG